MRDWDDRECVGEDWGRVDNDRDGDRDNDLDAEAASICRPDWMMSRTLQIGMVIGILAAVFVVYAPAMKAGYVWDDDHLLNDRLVRDRNGIARIWFSPTEYDDFPVTRSLLWAQRQLWQNRAAGYHGTNITLHALGAVLLWLVLRRLRVPGAWLAALLFAVHPVNVATVAWISEQKNTLCFVFTALTILGFLAFDLHGRKRGYMAALVLFFLALGSKTAVVALPVFLLALSWYEHGTLTRKAVLRTVPFFVLSLAAGLATIWFQQTRAIGGDVVRPEGMLSRIATAGWAPWFYALKTVFPANLMMIYPRWDLARPNVLSFVPGVLYAACFVGAWLLRERGRGPLLALAAHVLMLLPILGLVEMYYSRFSLVSDHLQYFAMPAMIALAVGAIARLLRRGGQRAMQLGVVVGLVIACVFGTLTFQRAGLFRNQETLWRDNVERNPECWIGLGNIAVELAKRGEDAEAVRLLETAVKMRPDFVKGWNNLGFIHSKMGQPDKAIGYLEQALAVKPTYAEAHKNMADVLANQGRDDKAHEHYLAAIQHLPDYAEAHSNCGTFLARRGRIEKALGCFRRAVASDPYFADAYFNLGAALLETGETQEALRSFQRAVDLKPELLPVIQSHPALGVVREQMGE